MNVLRRSALGALVAVVLAMVVVGAAGAYATTPDYKATDFVTGITNGGAVGPVGLAFDSTNHLWVMNYYEGQLYRYDAAGGPADAAHLVTVGHPWSFNNAAGIAFSKTGRLYVAVQGWGRVDEVDLATGGIARTVATGIGCATGIGTDPVSGDLFVTSPCGGPDYRISNFEGAGSPVVTPFGPCCIDGITFGPDGTIYLSQFGSAILRMPATDQPGFGSSSVIASGISGSDGVAVTAAGDPTKPILFANTNYGIVTKIDLSNPGPPLLTNIFTGGSRGDFSTVGPDGCLYITQTDRVVKITNADDTCSLAPVTALPSLSLAPASASHHVGEADVVTATLTNVSAPTGTPIVFTVTGANPQTATVAADASGVATFTYSGTHVGHDDITATTTIAALPVASNVAAVEWLAPLDVSPPSITPNLTGTPGTNGWWTSDVGLHWTVTDPESGIASSTGCDDVTFTASGSATCSATNGVGLSSSATSDVKIDKSKPTVTPGVSGPLGTEGWYVGPVSITWTVADPQSDIASTSGCDPSSVSSDTGAESRTCTATNGAGLSDSGTVTVKVDQTGPVVSYSAHPAVYDASDTVTITCSATDALSGVLSSTCAGVSAPAWSLGLGSHTLTASALDHAGNTGSGSTSYTVAVTGGGLCTLVQQWVSKPGVANSLCVKLVNAAAAADRGSNGAKANILAAFRNELDAQSGKSITAAHAATLSDLSLSL